ncbi:MAG: hypothetical protein JST40_04420 [Armatimonadetes bacterium]|nr:hypothetical protein [Armatimonadota bacterium]
MDARGLLESALKQSGFQVEKVFEGLSSEQWSMRPVAAMMTPAEQALHLAECYVAFCTEAQGGKHDWGGYVQPEAWASDPMGAISSERPKAVALALASESEDVQKLAMDFLTMHECYHVGQMCTIRLTLDETWSPYSIYGM